MKWLFHKYMDSYGMLVGSKEDPGDSIHRTFMFFLGIKWFTDEWPAINKHMLNRLECPDHLYRRHPSTGWWSDCDRFSRDQATPLVIALSELGDIFRLTEFFIKHLKRCFFFTNVRRNGATIFNHRSLRNPDGDPRYGYYDYNWKIPDFITPKFMAIYIRGFDFKPLRWLLYLLDLELIIRTLMLNNNRETDVLNHLIVSYYAVRKYPNSLSKFNMKLIDKALFNHKLEVYFNRVGMEPMAKLWGVR